jgi:hypothetical protein
MIVFTIVTSTIGGLQILSVDPAAGAARRPRSMVDVRVAHTRRGDRRLPAVLDVRRRLQRLGEGQRRPPGQDDQSLRRDGCVE